MKYLKLFVLAVAFLFAANTYSQWTYCNGSIGMSGLGSNPGIYCLDGNTALVMGGTGGAPKVYLTTNGGANFTNITGSLTGPEFFCGCIVNSTTFLVGDGGATGGTGGNAKIWRTTDAGVTWNTVLTTGGTVGFWNGIVRAATNPNFLCAQSDAPTSGGTPLMAISTNGGATWTVQTETGVGFSVGSLPAVYCIDNQFYGNGASTAPRVGFTTNGGTTWSGTAVTLTGTFTSGLAFNNNKLNGIMVTSASYPGVSRTTTGPGGTWSAVATGGTGTSTLNVLRYAPGTSTCYLATSVGIMQTNNDGATWSNMTTNSITGFFDISVQVVGGNIVGYSVASDGSVVKLSTPVAVDPTNTSTPTTFALQQNYPNPFNPATMIKFSVPEASKVTLKIYNSVGAEIMTVTDKEYATGNYVENVDMSSFSTGVYFYTLTAGNFKETKKMMLVK